MEAGPVKVQTGFLVQSIVNVPMRMGNKIVGVLGVYNRLAPRTFNEHHLTLMMALSDWAGVALEQATLKRSAKTTPLAPPPSSSGSTPELSRGIDQAVKTLEGIVESETTNPDDIQETLGALMVQLRSLTALPVVTLDAEQSSEMVNMATLVDMTVESMRKAAKAKGLDLISEREKNIPIFRGDPDKVKQVLEAVVAAAIRRTVRGRVILETHYFEILRSQSEEFPLTVNVEMHDGAWAAVRVSDSSPGLSPDTVQAITSKVIEPDSGQMGPGLSMGEIRMIVESMNGVMWYEHTPASTSITFALPIL